MIDINEQAVKDVISEHWHLDKKVPLALILTLLVQTGGIFAWAASTSERLAQVERRVEASSPNGDRLTRVEVKLETVQAGISEIKTLLRDPPTAPSRRDR